MSLDFEFTPEQKRLIQELELSLTYQNGFVPTLDYVLERWEKFVQHVEKGYSLSIDDYTIALTKRNILQQFRDICSGNKNLAEHLEKLEKRYKAATLQIDQPLLDYPAWWWKRIPAWPDEELDKWFWRTGQEDYIRFQEKNTTNLQKRFKEKNFRHFVLIQAALKKIRQDPEQLDNSISSIKDNLSVLQGRIENEWVSKFYEKVFLFQFLLMDLNNPHKKYLYQDVEDAEKLLDEMDILIQEKLETYPSDLTLLD